MMSRNIMHTRDNTPTPNSGQPRPLQIGATIPLNIGDLKDAITLWVRQTYGIEINPQGIQFDSEWDQHEEQNFLTGAHYDLDRRTLRELLNKEAEAGTPNPEDDTEAAAQYAYTLENRGDAFLNANERSWLERRRKAKVKTT